MVPGFMNINLCGDSLAVYNTMKSIIFISILSVGVFKISNAFIIASEPVVLILIGVCLVGLAKICKQKSKNENTKYSRSNHYVVVKKYSG